MQWPAFLDVRRLQGRMVVFFLGLLLLLQVISYAVVHRTVQQQAVAAADQGLRAAGSVLKGELSQRLMVEYIKASVLTRDAGFVQVLGLLHVDQAGRATLLDALDNHSQRVGARLAAFVDLRGQVVAAHPSAGALVAAARQFPAGEPQPQEMRLAVVKGELLQLLRVTARAPGPVGEVVFGFAVQPEQLAALKRYANVDAVVGVRDAQGGWVQRVGMAASEPPQLKALLHAARSLSVDLPAELGWQGRRLRAQRTTLEALGNGPSAQAEVLFWADLDEALQPARSLSTFLFGLNTAGVLLFAVGSLVVARRLSGPIDSLRQSAERLGAGDYASPVHIEAGVREVADLATAFETMRAGIQRHQADIERYAFWDRLTGLPNRTQFQDRLARWMQQPDRTVAVLVLNLDRFKPVNDALGRDLGDHLLRAVAQRLQHVFEDAPGGAAIGGAPDAASHTDVLGEVPIFSRLGGDEFGLAFCGADVGLALAHARRIHAALSEPVQLERRGARREGDTLRDELKVDVSVSVGIALYPEHGRHVDDLLTHAERAMDLAKKRQSGSLVFEDRMNASAPASLSLLSELRRAVGQGELRLFLQPKQDMETLSVRGAEALVRWQHPTRGMVPPGLFIPFAEETGFVRQLTQWVLRAAARQAAEAHARGLTLRIAVNLSTRDLLEADLLSKLQSMLAEELCAPEWLCLEITESAIMDDPKRALETVQALADAGFRLAIDDFGTGYSSLAYLQKLPVHEVKIDQSFVFELEKDANNQTIVRSTIELSHKLGKKVVAEGVESVEALNLLEQWGCDEAQGYYIARPMPAEQLLAKLSSGTLETRI